MIHKNNFNRNCQEVNLSDQLNINPSIYPLIS